MEVEHKPAQNFVRTRPEILSLLAEHADSNLTVKEFLLGRGIKENTFYYWRKHYGEKKLRMVPEKKSGFAVLEVKSEAVPATDKLFAEVGRIRIYQPVPAAYLKALAG